MDCGGVMSRERYLSAREAADELGVSLPTLYAYVSRGMIRSEAAGGGRRSRRYRAEDVRRLRERKEQRRDPGRAAEGALSWGMPVMESGITLVAGGRLYYRGRDAISLAAGSTFEEVAALIWTGKQESAAELFGEEQPRLPDEYGALRERLGNGAPVEAFQVLLALAGARDLAAYDLRPFSAARTGARILCLMTAAAGEPVGGGRIARTLQRGWVRGDPDAASLIDAALVLYADHELNVSTFTARCVASSGATPYAVVTAALSAIRGTRHGGQIELVEAFLREVEAAGSPREVIAGRLQRGEEVPGFGHSLYPGGDPRGAEMLRLAGESRPGDPAVALAASVAEAVWDLLGEHPNVDFGVVALARALRLPPGAAVTLFAVGRAAGWIGHAIEQYESGALIRPRARYVGEQPEEVSG